MNSDTASLQSDRNDLTDLSLLRSTKLFPIPILLLLLFLSPNSHAQEFEIVDGTANISGKPNATGSQARQNWEAACDQWKIETKELNRDDKLMMISCGAMSCDATDGIFTCSSNASFKVKTAGTRARPLEPVTTVSETYVEGPPPPVIIESTPAPRPGFIWIGGYWGYREHKHYWIGGHYEPHHHGYVYISPRWVAGSHHHGYHLEHGYWRR